MLLRMFTIFDAKAEAYIQPFFAPNDKLALRMFETAALDEKHAFYRNAEDYHLFEIGEFDQTTGTIKGFTPVPMANALEVRERATRA